MLLQVRAMPAYVTLSPVPWVMLAPVRLLGRCDACMLLLRRVWWGLQQQSVPLLLRVGNS
jgi:hypothetical protein